MLYYLLLKHRQPKGLTIFDSVSARAQATREIILGPPETEEDLTVPCPELLNLALGERVWVPSNNYCLEWVDAEIKDLVDVPRILELSRERDEAILRSKVAAKRLDEVRASWILFLAGLALAILLWLHSKQISH